MPKLLSELQKNYPTGLLTYHTGKSFWILDQAGNLGEFKENSPNSGIFKDCLLYTSPSPRDRTRSRMPSSA